MKIVESESKAESRADLDAIVREDAHRMFKAALAAEVEGYVLRHAHLRDDEGRRQVVRDGCAQPRTVMTGVGPLEVQAPRVNDKRVIDGERQRFTSKILPPYMRKSPTIAEMLPILYLRGLSTNDFQPALETLLRQEVKGLSATTITRMTAKWEEEFNETWREQSTCTCGRTAFTSKKSDCAFS